ncbi:MAG: tRNA (adenosine(37)-N6)-threonylcarbamoyltransferase complex ATPase subunit type 1 TsaE [Patescibacteria group bacterium]
MEIITRTFRQTQNLGEKLAGKLKTGGVVCLYGDLGSGKTTFTQGLAKGLGIKQKIISPTFIIARQYHFPKSFFYHVDLYRLTSLDDAKVIGLEEMWENKKNIVVIEWPEIIEKILPIRHYKVCFTTLSETTRSLLIN